MMQKTMQTARRFWMPLIAGAVLLCVLTVNAFAAVNAQLRPDMTIIIDGVEQTFYSVNGKEVHPILCGGSTYLPVRAIGEAMGKNVDWNQTTKTVTLAGNRTSAATAGTPDASAEIQNIDVNFRSDFTIVVDGKKQTFQDAAGNPLYPMLYNGSTYLPLRAIGELMGKTVSWDGETKTVTITGNNPDAPLVTDADSFSGGSVPAGSNAGLITAEAAKAAALNHAGLTADQVTFTKEKLEWDDGGQIYDIEFYTSSHREYEYEIDARTGAVLSFDHDHDHGTGSVTPPAATGTITRDKAQEIALAKVAGATAQNVKKIKTDRENGRLIYEVEIIYGGNEYEFEINAADGTVLKMEAESVHD
ncbi:MAG: PepSY domain-containing protein [Oscillospiraceae bacterium]|nr:PepSY domain-containing protein [Oscillospiraceae bacterium]